MFRILLQSCLSFTNSLQPLIQLLQWSWFRPRRYPLQGVAPSRCPLPVVHPHNPRRNLGCILSHSLLQGKEGGAGKAEAVQTAGIAPVVDLVELRQVVEAAVASALGRFDGQISGATVSTAAVEEDEELAVETARDCHDRRLHLLRSSQTWRFAPFLIQ